MEVRGVCLHMHVHNKSRRSGAYFSRIVAVVLVLPANPSQKGEAAITRCRPACLLSWPKDSFRTSPHISPLFAFIASAARHRQEEIITAVVNRESHLIYSSSSGEVAHGRSGPCRSRKSGACAQRAGNECCFPPHQRPGREVRL
jgi:hypothetical protein